VDQSKKECILSAAAKVFSRFGLKKSSVDEIAKDAGVAKGTIYLAAESKEDLFYQAVHREVRNWTGELSKLIDPRVPADELLKRCSLASLAYLNDRPLVRDLLFGNIHHTMPEWHDRLDELRALGRTNIDEILRLGKRQGLFREDIDLEEVAKLILDVAITTYLFHYRGEDKETRIARRLTTAFDMMMNGLRKHAAHAQAHAHKKVDAA
jgi:AcrR family transcriptional regulator